MKSWKKKLEDVFAAAAFAESHVDPASVPSLGFRPVATGLKRFMEDHFAAVAFAEAGEDGAARALLHPTGMSSRRGTVGLGDFLSDVGLAGVRVRLCVVQI
uniref:Uncharacterized protein n=1 Tax=Desulfacinum infernum TaxID=35837 RepID=A0A832A4B5_9BACT